MSATQELSETQGSKLMTQMLMRYIDSDGQRHARVLAMGKSEDVDDLIRTARWASYNSIEITLIPV